jgi:hypothetical protein
MSESKPQVQSAAQAGLSGEAAGVGSAVGVLRPFQKIFRILISFPLRFAKSSVD